MTINVKLGRGYDIMQGSGVIKLAGEYLNRYNRVAIITDDGVPREYANTVAHGCKAPFIISVPQGEKSKSLCEYERICSAMLEHGFDRNDCVAAVGGGVVGDLAGYVAATYMRGLDFCNIPTTVLAQADSSVGGKTAVNLGHIKNVIGAFKQPVAVFADTDVLSTLPQRHITNGLAEAMKVGLTSDAKLFDIFERGLAEKEISTVIERAVTVKKNIVETDELENGKRRILNFGHTVGHGIESAAGGSLLHGECVALGMTVMCDASVRDRIIKAEKIIGLPYKLGFDAEKVIAAAEHDKKMCGSDITVVYVRKIGECELVKMSFDTLADKIREAFSE